MNAAPFWLTGILMGALMLGCLSALLGGTVAGLLLSASIGLPFGYYVARLILKKLNLPPGATGAEVSAAVKSATRI